MKKSKSIEQPSKSWTRNLAGSEDKEAFSKRLLECKDLFGRLYALLEEKRVDNAKKRVAINKYELPSWSEYQADTNGYERALNDILALLEFSEKH